MAMMRDFNNVNENSMVKTTPTDVSFILTNGKVSLTIDKVDTSSSNWKIIQTEDYRPDKNSYIENEFLKDFKKFGSLSYEKITSLASRSRVVNEWLVAVSQKYAVSVDPPLWLQEEITSAEFQEIKPKVTALAKAASDRARLESEAAKRYKNELKLIESQFNSQMSKLKENDNILKVLSISSNDLPITLQLAIDNFTPSTAASAPNQRMFAREVLTSYKISLLKYSKTNPSVDIQQIIEEMATL